MRAVIYSRVSRDPRGEGRSVAEQEAECRALCARNGWDVVEVFCDNDRSAYRGKAVRPGYQSLIDFLRAGRADVLVTWEASRMQRDLDAYVGLRDICREENVAWCYSGQLYDLNDSDARFKTGFDALLAERESDQTRERILRSVRFNIENGRPHGKRPFGYDRDYEHDHRTGKLKPIRQIVREDQAEVIREIARRILAGESCYALAQDFNARGVATPTGKGTWDLTQVKRIAVNPLYIAKRVHRGEVVGDGNWPPILDESTHYQLIARLNDPARKTSRDGAVKHLLSGIATCGLCGGRMVVGKGRSVVQYICKHEQHVVRKVEWVDALIVDLVIARLSRPDAADAFTSNADDDATRDALAAITEKRARLDAFYDAAARGELTPKGLSRIEAGLLADIEALERQVRRLHLPTAVYELAKDPADVWERLSIVQRREVIRALLDIRILPTVQGGRFRPDSIAVEWKQDAA